MTPNKLLHISEFYNHQLKNWAIIRFMEKDAHLRTKKGDIPKPHHYFAIRNMDDVVFVIVTSVPPKEIAERYGEGYKRALKSLLPIEPWDPAWKGVFTRDCVANCNRATLQKLDEFIDNLREPPVGLLEIIPVDTTKCRQLTEKIIKSPFVSPEIKELLKDGYV